MGKGEGGENPTMIPKQKGSNPPPRAAAWKIQKLDYFRLACEDRKSGTPATCPEILRGKVWHKNIGYGF